MSLVRPTRVLHAAASLARLALLLAFAMVLPGGAQYSPSGQPQLPHAPSLTDLNDPAVEHRRMQALNQERQKTIVSDTAKLLKLAGELDQEVKKSDSDSWTPDEMRKLMAIERLAREVKDKMTFSMPDLPAAPEYSPQFPHY
jgi:hypothetical protein